jgi:hypothetical protein
MHTIGIQEPQKVTSEGGCKGSQQSRHLPFGIEAQYTGNVVQFVQRCVTASTAQ